MDVLDRQARGVTCSYYHYYHYYHYYYYYYYYYYYCPRSAAGETHPQGQASGGVRRLVQ